MNERIPTSFDGQTSGPEENIATELWRLWIGELKPHFEAEKDFLEKYGEETGYGKAYVARVLEDQRRMEELVWEKADEGVRQFAKVLGAHIRFKNEFFLSRVCTILELDGPFAEGTR